MIAFLLGAALAAEPLDASLGVGADMAAIRGSARHDLSTGLRLWGTWSPRPYGLTGEVVWAPHVDRTTLYAFRRDDVALSALAEVALAPHATTFRAGLGPAALLRVHRLDVPAPVTTARFEPGVRARVALDGPIGGHLAWSWHMGALAHPSGLDWDVGVGLGVAL